MSRTTAEDRLPGDPTPREVAGRAIRAGHAWGYGAGRIRQGQIAVLRGTRHEPPLRRAQAREQVRLDASARLIAERRVRPTALLPIWHVAGFALGAATAMLGHRGAMACTVAVEAAIDEHRAASHAELGEDEGELRVHIGRFRAEAPEQRDIGPEDEAGPAPGYRLLAAAIKAGCRAAIRASERV